MKTSEKQQTTMKWYIIKSLSNREKSVAEKLIKEGENGDLVNKIGKVFVPMEKNFSMKAGKKVIREKVMYPGYVFIECNAIGELKYFIKGLNGASGFLTNRSGDIECLSNVEIDKMLGRHVESQKKEINSTFVIGEDIRILDGPFANFNGSIEEIIGQKAKVSVAIFGRKTILELNITQIDKRKDSL